MTENVKQQLERQDYIDIISGLYPPDSDYEDTRRLGLEDMLCAMAVEWRSLPLPVLQFMARQQQKRDNKI